MKQDLLIDQLEFSLDCVTSITPISNAAHCTLSCWCSWLHVFCATKVTSRTTVELRPSTEFCISNSHVVSAACRSGLSWRPASHWSQGGSERPQTSEGHGELRLEHHRPQGEMTSSTPGIKEPCTILGDSEQVDKRSQGLLLRLNMVS